MAGLQRFRQRRGYWLGLGVLLAASMASRGAAQQGAGAPSPSAEREVVDPAQGGDDPLPYDQRPAASAGARYNEPGAPPFDYWQPTWMPCQSLRTNRSLVLGHLYFGMDILGWSTKGVHAPPLVTASDLASGGVIGQGNTKNLFGDEWLQNQMRPGGRLTIGWWFDPNQTSGVEFQYFELDGQNIHFHAAASGGNSFLGRPIIDATTGLSSAVPTASDSLSGSIQAGSDMQLTSTGILFRDLFWANQFTRVDYLVGYRHTHLYDRFRTDENLTSLDAASGFPAGRQITRVDQFQTVNQFDGLDLGLKGWWSKTGTLAITSLAKVALGASNNNVIINGSTTAGTGRSATTTPGGVLALPSNIGRRAQQEFGVVSEVGLGLEWQPICYWKFSLGYTWFYWSDVARALNQVDRNIDPSQLAPNNSTVNCGCPAFHLHNTSFWAQGINGGFTYQF